MALSSARGVALAALMKWRRGRRFADSILQQLLSESALSSSDRAFATELFYGILRHLLRLDFWIEQLRRGSVDDDLRDLLRLGLYQLFRLETPEHAAVFETVELAPRKARSFVNAILRNAIRRRKDLQTAAASAGLAIRMSHPQFLIDRWTRQFQEHGTIALCDWNNQPARLYARVNRLKTSVEDFIRNHPTALPVSRTEGFFELSTIPTSTLGAGACYIQDPSTALACELLDPQAGERVLDACAAPGGKTGIIGERMQNRGELLAADRDAARVDLLAGNLQRLGVTIARTLCHDWNSDESVEGFARPAFDRILLDAPCTNTGVMRRRVDLRWRLRPMDFVRMPNEQLTIVDKLVPLLKLGGVLVYSTCSIEADENEDVVRQILERHTSLRLIAQRSVLPFRDGFDGAFAAQFTRSV